MMVRRFTASGIEIVTKIQKESPLYCTPEGFTGYLHLIMGPPGSTQEVRPKLAMIGEGLILANRSYSQLIMRNDWQTS